VSGAGVAVSGVDVRRAADTIAEQLPAHARLLTTQAGQLVIGWARPRVPHRSGRAASSLTLLESQGRATVRAGGSRAPWYSWLDFGGAVGRGGATVRPFVRGGRYLYPGLRAKAPDIDTAQHATVSTVITAAGLTES
jgi:hypothetical protein